MVLYYLIKKGLLSFRLDFRRRLLLLGGLLFVLAFITPDGSMFTQVLLTVPIYLLIEVSTFFGNKHLEVMR